MKKKWWKYRIAFWVVGMVLMGWLLVKATPWDKWFPPAYEKYAADGKPIAVAVYQFRNDTGLWPKYMDDLVPKYLPQRPKGWGLKFDQRTPQLINLNDEGGRAHVGYDFDPASAGWFAWGPIMEKKKLNVAQEIPAPPKDSPETLYARQLAQYQAWLKAEPDQMECWQDLGGFLHAHKKTEELRAFLDEAKTKRVQSYWPRMARAVLEAESSEKAKRAAKIGTPFRFLPGYPAAGAPATATATGSPAEPATEGEKFVAWCAEHPTYMRYFYVYTYARILGDDAAALRAAQLSAEAIKELQPPPPAGNMIVVDVASLDDLYTSYYYLYRMARYALQMNDYATCLQICGKWAEDDKAERAKGSKGNRSFLPLAAAANLALGDFARAQALITDAGVIANHGGVMWAGDLEPLRVAVYAKDQTFTYTPNADGSQREFDVWEIIDQ